MKCFLFDFDGTLVDSMPTYAATMLQILDEYKIPYGDDLVKIITPLGTIKTAEYFVELGVPLSKEQLLIRMGEGMIDAYTHHIPAKEHVISALETMKANGCDLNVLTASPHLTVDPCLKRLGIYHLFNHVWSCDDFDTTKADPGIYTRAAEILGYPVGEVMFLDDNPHATATAKIAGMKVCGVFDPTSEEYREEMIRDCDYYLDDFSTLPTLA